MSHDSAAIVCIFIITNAHSLAVNFFRKLRFSICLMQSKNYFRVSVFVWLKPRSCWEMLRPCRVKRLQHFENKINVEKMLKQKGFQTASTSALDKSWDRLIGALHGTRSLRLSGRYENTREHCSLYNNFSITRKAEQMLYSGSALVLK